MPCSPNDSWWTAGAGHPGAGQRVQSIASVCAGRAPVLGDAIGTTGNPKQSGRLRLAKATQSGTMRSSVRPAGRSRATLAELPELRRRLIPNSEFAERENDPFASRTGPLPPAARCRSAAGDQARLRWLEPEWLRRPLINVRPGSAILVVHPRLARYLMRGETAPILSSAIR